MVKEIERLKERKRYGLVWEEKEEEVVEMCKDKLPAITTKTLQREKMALVFVRLSLER